MRRNWRARLAALAAILMIASPLAAAAQSAVTLQVQKLHPNRVQLQLFSQDRSFRWPSSDQVFVLDDFNVRNFPIACRPNENICYGAWLANDARVSWGVGFDGLERCADCCFRCDGGVTEIVRLRPGPR